MSLNRATLIGNLGSNPELRYLPSGQPAVGFSIATAESFTDKQGGKTRGGSIGTILSRSENSPRPVTSTSRKAGRFMSRGACGRASSTPRTTAASASAQRLSHPASSFLAHGQQRGAK